MSPTMETHFEHIQEVVIIRINNAATEILAAVAWFTDWEIYAALELALQRGVKLSLILVDDDINNHSNLDIEALRQQGARIYKVPPEMGTMHHKYCIIDRKILMMGSYNWTRKAANQNMESMMVVNDKATIEQFLAEYEKLLASIGENFVFFGSMGISNIKPRLRAEIRLLENDVTLLEELKDDIVSKLGQFTHQLHKFLGPLIIQHAELKAKLAKQQLQKTGSKIDEMEYETAQQKADETRQQVSGSANKGIPNLDAEKQTDIKKMYREAALMAHPDRFAGNAEKEQEATRIMAQLSTAYQNNDAEQVCEIWEALNAGTAFTMDLEEIDDITRLELIRDKLMAKKETLKASITSLEECSDWIIYSQYLDNISIYFEQVKQDLVLRIEVLSKQIKKDK